MGDERQKTGKRKKGDKRWETRDRRQEKEKGRQEMGDERQKTGKRKRDTRDRRQEKEKGSRGCLASPGCK